MRSLVFSVSADCGGESDRWILLNDGDRLRAGDEYWFGDDWRLVSGEFYGLMVTSVWDAVGVDVPVRRHL